MESNVDSESVLARHGQHTFLGVLVVQPSEENRPYGECDALLEVRKA